MVGVYCVLCPPSAPPAHSTRSGGGRPARRACHPHRRLHRAAGSSTAPLHRRWSRHPSCGPHSIFRSTGLGQRGKLRRSRRRWTRSPLRYSTSRRVLLLCFECSRTANCFPHCHRIILRVGMRLGPHLDQESETRPISTRAKHPQKVLLGTTMLQQWTRLSSPQGADSYTYLSARIRFYAALPTCIYRKCDHHQAQTALRVWI